MYLIGVRDLIIDKVSLNISIPVPLVAYSCSKISLPLLVIPARYNKPGGANIFASTRASLSREKFNNLDELNLLVFSIITSIISTKKYFHQSIEVFFPLDQVVTPRK
jgi:hypothetical protein